MKLHYKGSVRRLSGAGMAFLNFENDVTKVCENIKIECPETSVYIRTVYDDAIEFSVFYFEKETRFNQAVMVDCFKTKHQEDNAPFTIYHIDITAEDWKF